MNEPAPEFRAFAAPASVIEREQTRLLYAGLPSSLVSALGIALVLVAVQWRTQLPQSMLVGWLAVFVLLTLVRAGVWLAYRRWAPAGTRAWQVCFTALAALAGLLWGVAGVLLFPSADPVHQAFLGFAVAGVSAGAVANLSAHRHTALLFVLGAVPPLAIRFFVEGGTVAVAMGGMVLLFLVLMVATLRRIDASIRDSIRLRLEAGPREQALARQHAALTTLNEIAALPGIDARELLRQALAAGARYLELDVAIVSRIEGETYTVEVQSSPPGVLADGETFALGDTFCSMTVVAEDVVAISSVRGSPHAGHPCYRKFALESYIGAPVRVGGRPYGTVNFSSANARGGDFDAAEREFMRLLARWIGATIERLEATGRLSASERRWQFALEGSGDGIWDWNTRTGTVYFSRRWKEMLGYAEHEIGATVAEWDRLVHPDDKAGRDADLHRHFRGETPVYVHEHRMRCKDGSEKWILDRGQVIERGADGQPLRVIGIHTDVTERRQAMADLDRFKRVLDDTHDSIFMFDPESLRFVYLNRGAVESMGYSHAELLELTPYVIKPLMPEAVFRERIAPLLAGDKTMLNFETLHRRKDGSEFPVDILLQLVRERGHRGVFVAIVRDITARKQVERLKSEFVSTVSHELRTPLTSIRGALGLLAGTAAGELPEPGRELVRIAHSNAERLSRLINDILDIEKIASGKMRFDLRPHPIMTLVEQAVTAIDSYAAQHGVRVAITARIGVEESPVDAGRFQQVMDNLLSNAARFSPAGSTVEVAVERRPDSLQIAIVDRGPGIPAEFRKRVFEKFSQADASDTRARGGTGLGLAITREIVEGMGGRIGFDTEEGVGTTFRVEFPLWREPASGAREPGARLAEPPPQARARR